MTDLCLLIVTGVGRSGTSLLQSMLHAHSKIAFTKETHFIYNYLLPEYLKGGSNFNIDEQTKKKIHTDNCLSRLSFSVVQFLKDSKEKDLRSLYRHIHLQSNGNQTFYGDKDPYLVGLIPEVLEYFREAFVVHIIRDPRDVILSRTKSKWGQKNPLWVHLLEYKYGINATLNKKKNLDQKRYSEVRYEELLKSPQEELSQVCNKLNLEFEPSMLNYNLQSDSLVSTFEQDWKQNVSKELIKDNSNKWKKAFNSWQLFYIESMLDYEIHELGYHRSSPKSAFARIIQFCGHFVSKIYARWKYIKHRNR